MDFAPHPASTDSDTPPVSLHTQTAAPAPPPSWSSERLLAGQRQAEIRHGDQVYRLKLTALGKLILTK